MLILRKLEGITFYFSIFFISIQLGKHFWPDFAFVQGIRLDYLSPTLYLSDIFVLLFVFIHIANNFSLFFKFISKSFVLPFFLFSLLVSSLFAQNVDASIYWSLKVIEIILFGFCIAHFSFSRKSFYVLIDILISASLIQSIIALLQFLFQKSLGGPLYFLGERSFGIDTIGIATFFANGKEFLRPYGTFAHPNILALFLSTTLIFLLFIVLKEKRGKRVNFYSISFLPIFLALLLTASRLIIFLTFVFAFLAFAKSKKHLLYAFFGAVTILPVYFILLSERFLTLGALLEAFEIRITFITSSISVLQSNLIFGVGPNNTFYNTVFNSLLPIYARFQPVHNVYLQILLQIGVLGAIPTVIFLAKNFEKAIGATVKRKKFLLILSLLFFEISIVGVFDHFLVTLQQGMLLSALILGLLSNKSMEQVSD